MINYTHPSLPPLKPRQEYNGTYNETAFSNDSHSDHDSVLTLGWYILIICSILISIFGLWWNGIVIWLLGFCIKRTSFTTYILNLSMADFGLLTVSLIIEILFLLETYRSLQKYFLLIIFLFMYTTGQFLLTAISIDRCVAVLFPLWHRCHRPPKMSTIVCASLWGLSSISPAIDLTLLLAKLDDYRIVNIQFVVNGFICLPLITISTLILFIKVCFKSHQRRRGKLLTVILLALLFFIIFSFPINALFIIVDVLHLEPPSFLQYAFFYSCLNSCINPLIYFLVGRQKRGRLRRNMKAIFQNVFKEEESLTEVVGTSVETQLR